MDFYKILTTDCIIILHLKHSEYYNLKSKNHYSVIIGREKYITANWPLPVEDTLFVPP